MTDFPFVPVDRFTPNNSGWTTVGVIASWSKDATGRRFSFAFGGGNAYSLILQVLETARDLSRGNSAYVTHANLGNHPLKPRARRGRFA